MIALDWQWLRHPHIDALVCEISSQWNPRDLNSLSKQLRREWTAEQSRQLMELAELRFRAADKFTRANQMWLTRRALEQSTSEAIAQYKASCFPQDLQILDVCCGIGGDAIGFANRGPLIGIDRDPEMVQLAKWNLDLYGALDFVAKQASFADLNLRGEVALHVDPDRRVVGRTTSAAATDPPLDDVLAKAAGRITCIKMAPATRLAQPHALQTHREWIGHQRECKQQLLWANHPDKQAGQRSATVIDAGGNSATLSSFDSGEARTATETPLLEFLVAPHNAVVTAQLTDVLGLSLQASRIAPSVDLLSTAIRPPPSPLYAAFLVLEAVPPRWPSVTRIAEGNDWWITEWKRVGVQVPWWQKAIDYRGEGACQVSVILTRLAERAQAIFCSRLD